MSQTKEVSVLLLDACIQALEELSHAAEDQFEAEHQLVLDELHTVMIGAADASEEERPEPQMESVPEEAVLGSDDS